MMHTDGIVSEGDETEQQRAARWSVAHEDLAAIIAGAQNDKRRDALAAQLNYLRRWTRGAKHAE